MTMTDGDCVAYVINLRKDAARLTAVTERLAVEGIHEFELVQNDVPTALEMRTYSRDGTIAANCVPGHSRPFFKPGEVGHYLAFHQTLCKALQGPGRYALIFEDDAVLPVGFKATLRRHMSRLPAGWEVFALSWAKSGKNIGESVAEGLVVPQPMAQYKKAGVYVGLECVAVRKAAIRRILCKMFPMAFQTDTFLDVLKNCGYLQVCAPVDPVTCQDAAFPSNIQTRPDPIASGRSVPKHKVVRR